MKFQVIFYADEINLGINHVEYFDSEPSDNEIYSIARLVDSDFAELYEDINEDDEYKNHVASYHDIIQH